MVGYVTQKKARTRGRAHRLAFLCLMLLQIVGCPAWEVTDVRMNPTYICEKDTVIPRLTWNYAGPDEAQLEIRNASGESLCTGGRIPAAARECVFARAVAVADLPLRAHAFVGDEEKHVQNLGEELFFILKGPRDTEVFKAPAIFGGVEKKREFDDNGKLLGIRDVRRAETADWDISAAFFSSDNIETRLVRNPPGGSGCGARPAQPLNAVTGPGLDPPSRKMDVGASEIGNKKHPRGTWTEKFEKVLEINAGTGTEGFAYYLQFEISCE